MRGEYDLIIIAISAYAEQIQRDLIDLYHVDEACIAVFQPIEREIIWEDERIVSLRKCIAMLKERNVPGSLAEVGVYTGEFAKLLNRYLPDRKLYLFDTFSGFDSQRDEVQSHDLDKFKDTSPELVLSKMRKPENCMVFPGYFPDTASGVEDTFCLVSLDCDLYAPILAGLEFFYPRLEKGGYIFIHDFGSYHFEEVKKAVYAYCDKHNAPIFPIVDRCLSVIISK